MHYYTLYFFHRIKDLKFSYFHCGSMVLWGHCPGLYMYCNTNLIVQDIDSGSVYLVASSKIMNMMVDVEKHKPDSDMCLLPWIWAKESNVHWMASDHISCKAVHPLDLGIWKLPRRFRDVGIYRESFLQNLTLSVHFSVGWPLRILSRPRFQLASPFCLCLTVTFCHLNAKGCLTNYCILYIVQP